jgi:hypothetical protein
MTRVLVPIQPSSGSFPASARNRAISFVSGSLPLINASSRTDGAFILAQLCAMVRCVILAQEEWRPDSLRSDALLLSLSLAKRIRLL